MIKEKVTQMVNPFCSEFLATGLTVFKAPKSFDQGCRVGVCLLKETYLFHVDLA